MPTIICKARMTTGWMFVACFALVCASAGAAAAQTAPSRVVVFGDSLSDPGNGFALTHEVSVPPDYSMNGKRSHDSLKAACSSRGFPPDGVGATIRSPSRAVEQCARRRKRGVTLTACLGRLPCFSRSPGMEAAALR